MNPTNGVRTEYPAGADGVRAAAAAADHGPDGSTVSPAPGSKGLHVRMFSSFSMEYEGTTVNMTRGGGTKVEQIFARLLISGEKGVSKRELIGSIYGQGQESGADLNQYVNNLIYRLKKRLLLWNMKGASISLENGICRFEASFPVTVDAIVFQQLVERGLALTGTERTELLEEAVGLYSGEFLEEFCTELWVIQKDHELKQMYFKACEALGDDYCRSGNYHQARDIYHRAALLFPFDLWQLSEMDCLIALKDYDAAYAVYQDTERIYDEELGISPGEEFSRRLHVIEKQSMHPARRLSDILQPLQEEYSDGAFYCYYTDFLHFCQILARIAERSGQSLFRLLCTWSMGRGSRSHPAGSTLESRQMDILKDVIGRVFRRGDIYTRYSSCQYLIILSGTDRENGAQAFERLRRAWSRQEGAQGELSYSMDSLLGFRQL